MSEIYGYCTKSWPVVKGCSPEMPCAPRCWAADQCHRLAGNPNLKVAEFHQGLTTYSGRWTGEVKLNEAHMRDPLRWRNHERVAVAYHGDLFRAARKDVVQVFTVMNNACHHQYFVLTKLPSAMVKLLRNTAWGCGARLIWPHVLLGVSIMDQAGAEAALPHLRELAAAGWRTWVSYEPALGPVDWRGWEFLSYMVIGGESGPAALPCDVQWIRDTVEWCFTHRHEVTPVFVKQLGAVVTGDHEEFPTAEHLDGCGHRTFRLSDRKGADHTEWPEDLRVRQYPEVQRG